MILIFAAFFLLVIAGSGYDWCQKSWQCGSYSVFNFSLPTSSPCEEIQNFNSSNNKSFETAIAVDDYAIEIWGEEVTSVPNLDNPYYSKINEYINKSGYKYIGKKDFWIDNCKGNNSIGVHNGAPGQIWHMRYWKPMRSKQNLQVTILIKNPTGKIPEEWTEYLNKSFRVEVK